MTPRHPLLPSFMPLRLMIDRDQDGRPLRFMPQSRYEKAASTPLNAHGAGPFCRLRVVGATHQGGVYALTVDSRVTYVGRCQDLASRFGSTGYGGISPKNCYKGGQATNCKVNHAILLATEAGSLVEAWFRATDIGAPLEAEVIRRLQPPWNGNQPGG
jgi:hypothetical protein